MGSFTLASARALLLAMFPNNQSAATPSNTNQITSSTGATAAAQRSSITVYSNSTAVANSYGLYGSGTTAGEVRHGIHLIAAGTNAGITASALTDSNFTGVALQGNLGATGVAITLPPIATNNYTTYASQAMPRFTGGTAYSWKGWALTASVAEVTNEGQISFPQNLSGNTIFPAIVGFLIHTDVTTTSDASGGGSVTAGWINGGNLGTTGSTTTGTSGQPTIIAYGDLSTYRSIQASDTPVFTSGAIKITLD